MPSSMATLRLQLCPQEEYTAFRNVGKYLTIDTAKGLSRIEIINIAVSSVPVHVIMAYGGVEI